MAAAQLDEPIPDRRAVAEYAPGVIHTILDGYGDRQAATAQVSDKRAACSQTVCVAFSCLSGG
jgi:hypothetical protein